VQGIWHKTTSSGQEFRVVLDFDGSVFEKRDDMFDSEMWEGRWRSLPDGRVELKIGAYTSVLQADVMHVRRGLRRHEIKLLRGTEYCNGEVHGTVTLRFEGGMSA
jgi:hypothetical protein